MQWYTDPVSREIWWKLPSIQPSAPGFEPSYRGFWRARHWKAASARRYFSGMWVNRVLEGRAGEIKEVTIGVEAFGLPPGYDTKADARVRTAAVTLRKKLNEYYLGIGAGDPIRIELPKGTYIPSFREIKLETASETAPFEPVRILRPGLRTLLAVIAGSLIVALVFLLVVRGTSRGKIDRLP